MGNLIAHISVEGARFYPPHGMCKLGNGARLLGFRQSILSNYYLFKCYFAISVNFFMLP